MNKYDYVLNMFKGISLNFNKFFKSGDYIYATDNFLCVRINKKLLDNIYDDIKENNYFNKTLENMKIGFRSLYNTVKTDLLNKIYKTDPKWFYRETGCNCQDPPNCNICNGTGYIEEGIYKYNLAKKHIKLFNKILKKPNRINIDDINKKTMEFRKLLINQCFFINSIGDEIGNVRCEYEELKKGLAKRLKDLINKIDKDLEE